jgi:aminoglycoside phosphotransferase (APT) family kinase protein
MARRAAQIAACAPGCDAPVNEIAAAIARAFGAAAAADPVDAVSTCRENRSWYLTVEDTQMVAKTPERSGGLTIAPALEYDLLANASAAGVTPRPLGFDPVSGTLFVQRVAGGRAVARHETRDAHVVEGLAEILRTLHSLEAPSTLRTFDPSGFADAYCAGASAAALRLRDELETGSAQLSGLLAGGKVCHNDLHAGNILAGDRLWLIDFEYAVRAAPIVDIASYAAFNDLDVATALYLARACLGDDLPFSGSELMGVVRIQQILGELWEMARSDNNSSS